ncbi:MAG: hypothetical protein AAF515_19865 [Pseudomonadota bacterium]
MRRPQRALDHDGLQADVMRFMAIIAFCLVAILALVRNVEAPPGEPIAMRPPPVEMPVANVGRAEPEAEPPPTADSSPAETVTPVATAPPEAAVASTPVTTPDAEPSLPASQAVSNDERRRLARALSAAQVRSAERQRTHQAQRQRDAVARREAQRASRPSAEPVVGSAQPVARPIEPASVAQTEPAPVVQTQSSEVPLEDTGETEPTSPAEEGLSLRFASEHDFLRLLSSGQVELFLFDGPADASAFKLGRGFDFAPARPPGQLYELLPATIPAAISGSAARRIGSFESYKWGVRMPSHVEAEIRRLVGIARTGSLLIDRHGQVRHENS